MTVNGMILVILEFVWFYSSFGATADTLASWIIKNGGSSEEQIFIGNILECHGFCTAMWKDGDGVSFGEHYWNIHFESNGRLYDLSVTNEESFEREPNYKMAPHPYQRIIKAGDTVGLLVSFSSGKFKCYYKYNNESIELGFELLKIPKHIYPAITFTADGPAKITKETGLPSTSEAVCDNPKNIAEIEGRWVIYAENINFNGVPLRRNFIGNFLADVFKIEFRKCIGSLVITPVDTNSVVGQYTVTLKIVNRAWSQIKYCDGSWKGWDWFTTLVGGPGTTLERPLFELVGNPERFKIVDKKLILVKENSEVTFER